jgi:hypothetical protein
MCPLTHAADCRSAGTAEDGTAGGHRSAGRYGRRNGCRHGHRYRDRTSEAADTPRAEGTEGTERPERAEAQAETETETASQAKPAKAETAEAQAETTSAEGTEPRPGRHSNRQDCKSNDLYTASFFKTIRFPLRLSVRR